MARVETRVQHWEMHLFAAAHQAFCYEKENTPYVTTESVLLIIELLRGHILGWKSAQVPGAEWMKYPILKNYDRALFDRKYEEFKTRWHQHAAILAGPFVLRRKKREGLRAETCREPKALTF